MEAISIFDIFKIGVGPSSSHTLGPWKAAKDFVENMPLLEYDRLEVVLYGSLSKTGKGHATDIAVQLGLLAYDAETVDVAAIPFILDDLKTNEKLPIKGKEISFIPKKDIVFSREEKSYHPNTLEFNLYDNNTVVYSQTYLSVGGGFIQKLGEEQSVEIPKLPYPIESCADLIGYLKKTGLPISEIVLQNELSLRSNEEIEKKISQIFKVTKESIINGLKTSGVLPGGLKVMRRACAVSSKLLEGQQFENFEQLKALIRATPQNFRIVNNWVSCFALAVNEENASMGRIVTSPTNGAAGVIPAVLFYYYFFCERLIDRDRTRFYCTAGEIGSLFKKGATISAAVGGCQAEIGVSSAMAAGGLTELLGGTPEQVLMAAEIAMEHHLGLTCDPIGGLVQIPCIERNAMGAIKAITAANLALSSNPKLSIVSLDMVIKTMWDTALEMSKKYKETSEGGLAFNIPVISPEC